MPLSEFSQAQTSTLKGLPGSFELCDQTQFRSLKKQIESLEFSKLNFFRSDMDIRRLLIYLNSNDLDFFQKMKILDHLKSFRVCRIDESIVGEYLRCFQKFDENLPENKTLLSSLLIVADNLIPKEFWNEQISEVILNAKCKVDSRCNSGMLSLLAEKAPRDKFEAYAERILADSQGPDFRSVGNYLIVKAKAGLTDELLRQCVRMLKSKNDFELATGIYATSRIIQAQKNIDPVALSQFSLVKDLILRIQGLQSHQDIMVSRRALFEMRDLAQLENS